MRYVYNRYINLQKAIPREYNLLTDNNTFMFNSIISLDHSSDKSKVVTLSYIKNTSLVFLANIVTDRVIDKQNL